MDPKTKFYSTRPLYGTWDSMKQRCYNKNAQNYSRYGKKGVKVCDRWFNDYRAFEADMGPKPTSDHSLDRIDPSGHYCPENCRWATVKEQTDNRRIKTNTGYRYISLEKNGRYLVCLPLKVFGKRKFIRFSSLEDSLQYLIDNKVDIIPQ